MNRLLKDSRFMAAKVLRRLELEGALTLCAWGMTTREIREHLEEIYGVEVSPALLSAFRAKEIAIAPWRPNRRGPTGSSAESR